MVLLFNGVQIINYIISPLHISVITCRQSKTFYFDQSKNIILFLIKMSNFVIFNNKTIDTFDNNVISYPTSLNNQFVLKKELKDGLVSYSWINSASSGGTSGDTQQFTFDIDRVNYDAMLNDILSLQISTNFFILNLYIPNIVTINNLNTDVYITVNNVEKFYINTLAEYQQIICHVDNILSDTIIECNVKDQIILESVQFL